jgi:hypothetical protein
MSTYVAGSGATRNNGNPQAHLNARGNSGGGQAANEAARAAGHAVGAAAHVMKHPDAAPAPRGFSFARVRAVQCESNEQYHLHPSSREYEFFHDLIADIFKEASALQATGAPSPPLLTHLGGSGFNIEFVKLSQLLYCPRPDTSLREPNAQETGYKPDGVYEVYRQPDGKYMTQNPRGVHFEIKSSKSWPWSIEFVLSAATAFKQDFDGSFRTDFIAAARVKVVPLPASYAGDAPYLPMSVKKGSKVVVLDLGELQDGEFVPWQPYTPDCTPHQIYLSQVKKLTTLGDWKLTARTQTRDDDEAEVVHGTEAEIEALDATLNRRFTFQETENCLAVFQKRGKEEGKWIALCEFMITEVLAVYQYANRDIGKPVYRLKCHRVLSGSGRTVKITPEEDLPLQDNDVIARVEAEVLVDLYNLKDKQALHGEFAKVSAYLECSELTLDHLKDFLSTLDKPRITRICTYFGRQKATNLFVAGNCCYQNGKYLTHEEAGVSILPACFSGAGTLLPMDQDDYPKHLLIAQPHVRYVLFMNLWNNIMPRFFHNNVLPAKATLALFVMGFHTSKFWAGEAVGHGHPQGYIKSQAGNTGKTEILLAGNSILGFFKRGVWSGVPV